MITVDYYDKLRLAMMIEHEISTRYLMKKVAPYKSDVFKKRKTYSPLWGEEVYQYTKQNIKSVHGILERNLKIVEVQNGFEILVPKAYGEKYIEDCLKVATKTWLKQLGLKGKVEQQ